MFASLPACVLAAALCGGCATSEHRAASAVDDAAGADRGLPIARPAVPPAAASVSRARPDLDCRPPPGFSERLDGFDAADAARLRALLADGRADGPLAPQDQALLGRVAEQVVWLPPLVEAWIAARLVTAQQAAASRAALGRLPEADLRHATTLIGGLLGAAPALPFDLRLLALPNHEGVALAGGDVALDPALLAGRAGDAAGAPRLAFAAAYEVASIHKRYRTLRLQFSLAQHPAGQQLMRRSLALLRRGGPVDAAAWTFWRDALAPGSALLALLRQEGARFVKEEFDADACAVSMLAKLGEDPVVAFDAYARRSAIAGLGGLGAVGGRMGPRISITDRERRIREKALAVAAPARPPADARPAAPAKPMAGPSGGASISQREKELRDKASAAGERPAEPAAKPASPVPFLPSGVRAPAAPASSPGS